MVTKQRRKQKHHRSYIKVIWSLVSIVGVIGSLAWIRPRIGIEMSGSFNPLDSKSWANVVITNNGLIPLRNVAVGVRFGPFQYIPAESGFDEAETILGPDTIDTKPYKHPGFGFAQWKTDELGLDQKFTVRMPPPVELKSYLVYPKHVIENKPGFVKLFRLHMSVIVDYNFWIFPFRLEKSQMFRTVPSEDCNDCLDWIYM